MKPRGPRALLRNKENPELERIPRAPGGLQLHPPSSRGPAPRLSPPPAAPRLRCHPSAREARPGCRPGRGSGAEPPHLRHAPRPPRPPPDPAGPAPPCFDTPARPGASQPAGPQRDPPALPSPEGASELPPGSRTPQRITLGRGGPSTPKLAVPAPCKRRSQTRRRGGRGGERGRGQPQGSYPGGPRVGGGGARPSGVRAAPRTDRESSRPQAVPPCPEPSRRGSSLPGSFPPSRPRARAAALTLHWGARGSCSLLPPPALAAAHALPGRARAAGGRGGGWRRSGPRAGASWRRRPGPARSARLSSARRPSLPSRRRRARLPPLGWLRSGGRGLGAEQGACLRPAPRTAPPPPPEARPAAASVCPCICRSMVPQPPRRRGTEAP